MITIPNYYMDIFFYPRRNDATSADGRCSIYCSIKINSEMCVPFSTGVKVIVKNWVPSRKTTNDEFGDTIRQELLRIEHLLRRIKISLEESNEPVTSEIIKDYFLKSTRREKTRSVTKKSTFEEIAIKIIENKMNLGASESTKKHDTYLYKNFVDFAKKKGFKAIEPSDITVELIEDYIKYFGSKSKIYLKQSLKFIEKCLDVAVRKGLAKKNIMSLVEKPKGSNKKTTEIGLELHELELLKKYISPNLKEQQAIDIFLFMCGTGLDFCDYNRLESGNITPLGEKKIIRIDRQKTNRYDTNRVCHQNAIMKKIALDVLKKYGSVENLPKFKYSYYLDKILKKVASKLGIEKNLTTKRARKTFANISINYEKHSDEQTAYQMGHTSTNQLKSYRSYNDKIIENLVHLPLSYQHLN